MTSYSSSNIDGDWHKMSRLSCSGDDLFLGVLAVCSYETDYRHDL
jgi:hypothetical protein